MCRSMVDIQSAAAEIRRGKKRRRRRRRNSMKIYMVSLLHRATIKQDEVKVAGVPQTPETISAASGPKFTIL